MAPASAAIRANQPSTELVERLEQGNRIGTELADVGVRWIVLLRTGHAPLYDAAFDDPTLELVLHTDEIDVLEVRAVGRRSGTTRWHARICRAGRARVRDDRS